MPISAGDLRRYVSVEKRSTSRTPSGDQVNTWTTVFSAYANISPASSREKFAAGDVRNLATHTIAMRYDSRLTGDCRIVWQGRYFTILGRPRNTDEDGEEMIFEAQEGMTNV